MTLTWSSILTSSSSMSSANASSSLHSSSSANLRESASNASSNSTRNAFEGSLDLRDVKEVRQGVWDSKDFAKWSEDVPSEASSRCFVVSYGQQFNLKTLSCMTLVAGDCAVWCRGLRHLTEDAKAANNGLRQERYLRKCFYLFESPTNEGFVGLAEAKKLAAK